jgi:hypothetical protein
MVAFLAGWNYAQNDDRPRVRLAGELLLVDAVICGGLVVVGGSLASLARLRWVPSWIDAFSMSGREALAWATITVAVTPIAILHRPSGVIVFALAWAAFATLLFLVGQPFAKLRRLRAAWVSAALGSLALICFAWLSRGADVNMPVAAPMPMVPGGDSLAWQLRPLLFFDGAERYPPVDISDVKLEGCKQSIKEDCDPVEPSQALDSFSYLRLTGTKLDDGEKPGGPASAYYYHVVPNGNNVYIDYWWYFAENPSPVAGSVLCGQGLKWLNQACAKHPADWEGMTLVLAPCSVTYSDDRCVAGGDRSYRVIEAHYAQHEKIVSYPWERLQSRWKQPDLAKWFDGGQRPLVFVAFNSHASYAAPCPSPRRSSCKQIAHPRLPERRDGLLSWTNNDADGCASDCLHPLPLDADGAPGSWNAFDGRWGAQNCILFGSYCDVQKAPLSPSFQTRYQQPACPPKSCVPGERF